MTLSIRRGHGSTGNAAYFCLTVFCAGRGIIKNIIVILSNFVKRQGSRIAYTTRDKNLQSQVSVDFSPRAATGKESEQTLLNHANFGYS